MFSVPIFHNMPDFKISKENSTIRFCKEIDCKSENCDENICKCDEFYYNNKGNCDRCPEIGEICTDCCGSPDLECQGVCVCIDYERGIDCSNYQAGVFVTASQVALSAALIMGIAALAMVIYRLCTRPRYLSARHRADIARTRNLTENELRSGLTSSLTSLQIRIMSRLRDRPPAYDGSLTQSAIAQDRNGRSRTRQVVEDPPPYMSADNGPDLDIHRPPPYNEVILNPSGYLNESYVNTETTNGLPCTDTSIVISICDQTDIKDPEKKVTAKDIKIKDSCSVDNT